jgi:hypothetical protein
METKLTQSFEDFLKYLHDETFTGTGDDAPEAFDTWLADFDGETWMECAEDYAKSELLKFANEAWRLADSKAD